MKIENIINQNFNKNNFIDFIKESLNATSVDAILNTVEDNEYIASYQKVAHVKLQKDSIDFFIFEAKTKNIDNVRVGFNKFISSLVPAKYAFDGAIVAIWHPQSDTWRLSFVNIEFSDANKKELKTRPQRYTFEIGKNIVQKTALEQLEQLSHVTSIKELQDVFSVERVSKKFFNEYKGLYFDLLDILKPEIALFRGSEVNLKLFSKKLLGRIVFLYFLQKKGWLGSQKKWGDGNRNFLNKLYDDYISNDNSKDFYGDILNPIFFRALNTSRENDYFKLLECKMPFLNGGLFTPSEFDEDSKHKPIVMLDNKFFDNIFNTFNSYNFTIIEDTPHESEVAIDPEMLGRVFEDLLEDRKEKGAFYTPREIVHYMAKKSIHNYLESEVKEYSYIFDKESFLEKTSLGDGEILDFFTAHPIKFIKLENYFTRLFPYKNFVIDFWIVAKLRGFRLNTDGVRTKTDSGHPTVTSDIWKKILYKEYELIDFTFGSNKEIKLGSSYQYPTILKYIKIDSSYFALAFLPNIWGDLELTTIYPTRLRGIKSKLKKFGKPLEDLSEKSFAFDSKVFEKIKELREDCRSLHPEPHPEDGELPRQAVVQKGLSTFHNSFKIDSIASFVLKAFLKDKDYYNKSINKLLNNSDLAQDKLRDIMRSRLKDIKTLDPAIGSGAFPMGVLHEIVDVRITLGDTTPLSKMKREIIENNIYGIDIEESAVEIAKLRFWLSIVVDEVQPEPLPNLFYKIMVGNSLVETANGFDLIQERKKGSKPEQIRLETLDALDKQFSKFYDEHDKHKKDGLRTKINLNLKTLFDEGLNKYSKHTKLIGTTKLEMQEAKTASLIVGILKDMYKNHYSNKIFLYKMFFKEVMDKGGFDLIIGNPPYLRVQGIEKEISEQYKKNYDSATGSYDLYVLFVEQALSKLSKNGIVNYIMPHKWINSSFGKGLREIAKNKVSYFISFGAYQVFNASTYTSLVWWQNNKHRDYLEYVELDKNLDTNKELEEYLFGLNTNDFTQIKNSELSSSNWTFTDKKTYDILEKLKKQPLRVKDIFEKIFQGIATSKDSIYFLKNCKYKDSLVTAFSDELQKEILIEKDLTRPLLKGGDVQKYKKLNTNKVVIVPYYNIYENNKEKAILYTEKELKEKFPNGYKYLKECEDVLKGREKGRLQNDDYWFRYIYPKNLTLLNKEKIITSEISLGTNMMYDNNNFYINTKNYCLVKHSHIEESYKFYLSILNSKLMWYFIKNTGYVLSGGYYTFKTNYLNPFPIPKIENLQDTKPFEILVDKIIKLKEENKPTKNLEDEIDSMVYKLYDLSPKEIELIQESTKV